MCKKFILICFFIIFSVILSGCDTSYISETIEDSTKPKVSCSIDKQYADEYGISYYIEGTCTNNSSKDYDYLQVEFICYDKDGNNLGTAFDNTNNLLGGQNWKFKAMAIFDNVKNTSHCDYHEVTGW